MDYPDWNGIKVHPNRSEIVNERDDVLVVVYGENHHRDARRLSALHDANWQLRGLLTRALEHFEWYEDHGYSSQRALASEMRDALGR